MNRLGLVWSCALLVACGGEARPGPAGAAGSPSSGGGEAGVAGATEPSVAGVGNAGGGAGGEGGAIEGGLGGQAGAAPDSALEPVVIIRGGPDTQYVDLIVRGRELHEHEGAVVTVRIGSAGRTSEEWSERLGSGQARVRQGRFELHFPQVWESTMYKFKYVYIDANADGRCSEEDPVYADASAVLLDNTLDIPTPFPSFETCEPFERPWPTE